ncbi:SMI1/KNR4 family protein [Stieleria sp.]|uniref:SMI1/KNR4 family protein n=1 Tax=Stieleria sp. TaxID=2795976 RepID=UPI0035654292
MADFATLVRQLENTGKDLFWQGRASDDSIKKLQALLATPLPDSFRDFIATYGGGGVVEEEISGIEDNDASLDYRGTVYGDTLRCREDYALPDNLVVIYFTEEGVVWCLDVSQFTENECPVVSFDIQTKTTVQLAPDFLEFFREYVSMRVAN